MPAIKITETTRSAALRRPLTPSVTRDRDIPGLALHVTKRRGFWAVSYQPHGINPATGKRWGGGTRDELGDAMLMTVKQARTAAMAVKARVRMGHDPHRERMNARAAAVEERSILPKSVGEALDVYAQALMSRRQPLEPTRRAVIHYARKAIHLMQADSLAIQAIDARMVNLMLETMAGSEGERYLVFTKLSRFLAWCRKRGLVEHNPCDDFDRDERPKQGRSRDHVPTIDEIKAIWNAAENEPQRDMIRFMLLTPLRRREASGLKWSEVDLQRGRIRIEANRMKQREAHELPLSPAALTILESRKLSATNDIVFPSSVGKPHGSLMFLTKRLRKVIGQDATAKAQRFTWHDVRRSFVSLLAEHGFDIDLLDQCLGHKRAGVRAIYQRASRMGERARALEAWAQLIVGEEVEHTGKVVPLRVSGAA
jgi:integrase